MILALLRLPAQAALRVGLCSSHQVHATHMAASLSGRMTVTGAAVWHLAGAEAGANQAGPEGSWKQNWCQVSWPLDTTAAPMNRASVPEVSVNQGCGARAV